MPKSAQTASSVSRAFSFGDPRFAEQIRAGKPRALRSVVDAYLPQILRTARASGLGPQGAEEVTQATFLTFIARAEQFEGRAHVRTWLFGILFKKIAEARRDLDKDLRTESIESLVEQRFDSKGRWARPPRPVDMQLYHKEVGQLLEKCLDGLPTQQRMAFVLREVEGLESEEICKILEITRTNLGVLLYRGRNRLRECLEAKGVRGT